MSQCCARKCGFTLVGLILSVSLLCACTMAELERFATEASQSQTNAKSGVAAPIPGAGGYLSADHVIRGGKQAYKGALGSFARMLVGENDEIQFMRPVAISGQQEFLYIVDADARIVFRYNLLNKDIEAFSNVGVQFAGQPGNIYVTRDLSFYVVDSVGKQVLQFNPKGEFVRSFQDAANLSRPLDVKVLEDRGEVWVADGSYSHIIVFNMFGTAMRRIGMRGTGPGRFRAITDVALGKEGVYVLDRLELPIQVLTDTGMFKYSFGESEQVFPSAIAISDNELVFVADKSDNTIRVYENGILVSKFGAGGAAPGRFREITDLWIRDDMLYVADSMNRRIQVLKITSTPPAATPASTDVMDQLSL